MWKLMGRIQRLAARSTPSAMLLLLVEVRALTLSAKFSAQSGLNDFFDFLRLAVANENGHNLFLFFEGI